MANQEENVENLDDNDDSLLEDDAAVGIDDDDAELTKMKERMQEIEQEAKKLKMLQEKQNEKLAMTSPGGTGETTEEERIESDSRSIYIGSCDYGATPEEVEEHFKGCGKVNRVMIKTDKFTGRAMGYAYLEFAEKESVELSQALDGSLFRGRQLSVKPKRHNIPGLAVRGRGRGRGGRGGRGFRGRGRRGRGRRGRGSFFSSPY